MTNDQYNELLARHLALKDDMIRLNRKVTATMSMVFTCANLLMTFAELAEMYAPLVYKRVLTAKDVQEWLGTEDFFETAEAWQDLRGYTHEKMACVIKKLLDHYGVKKEGGKPITLTQQELADIAKKYEIDIEPVDDPDNPTEEPNA